jgi:uncharacterized protein (DUF2336 family)
MTERLTANDVSRLLTDPSADHRADTAAKIALQFEGATLTPSERRIAEDIFRLMVKDAEVRVREALSKNLKESADLPRDIARNLAADVESVAVPMLEFSEVLTDADLIEIARRQGAEKQKAIARRASVSESVADALVDHGNEAVVVTLVGNEGARISEPALRKVVEKHGDSEAVQRPLVERAVLPVTVAERLVSKLSDNLRDYLVSHHELPPTLASDLVLETRERATVGLLHPGDDDVDVELLIEQLHCNGRLTPSLILRAICVGDIGFMEASLAALARIPLVNARALAHDQGALGLRSLYDKAGLPPAFFPAFRAAVDVAKQTEYDGQDQDRERFARRMLERIVTQVEMIGENLGEENVDYLMAKLNRITGAAPPPLP